MGLDFIILAPIKQIKLVSENENCRSVFLTEKETLAIFIL